MLKKVLNSFKDGTIIPRMKNYLLKNRRIFKLDNDNIKEIEKSYLIYKDLKNKYSDIINQEIKDSERVKNDTIWVSWFQGLDSAPILCQTCVERMYEVFGKNKVKLLTADNYQEYVHLPDYIINKWQEGIITNAHFSDILRTALLVENGGTWIDATILILKDKLPKYFYDSELFIFADHISGIYPNIQSSYISAYKGSKILQLTLNLLYEYWKKENYLVNYSLFHLFFQIALEKYPDEWNRVYKYPNHSTHILRKNILDKFDKDRYESIKDVCPIQKLTYKKEYKNIEDTFYEELIIKKNF